jgi:hypothetical protein
MHVRCWVSISETPRREAAPLRTKQLSQMAGNPRYLRMRLALR